MNLLELRKYAIDHRVEIRFGDPHSAQVCVVNERGLVKIPGEDKDLRVDDVLAAAQKFEVLERGVARHFTREALAQIVAKFFEKAHHSAAEEEEE